MAMKETVFSIRAYFDVIGVFSIFFGLSAIIIGFIESPLDMAVFIYGGFALGIGTSYLYAGIRLPTLLQTSTKFVRTLLYFTGFIYLISAVIALMLGFYGKDLIMPSVGVLINWYLLLNVKRLEEEHRIEK